ncbi:MAG: sulfatase [Acidobacteria bacterium]|nr:sulfatase [Acidobacteriota bacterium]
MMKRLVLSFIVVAVGLPLGGCGESGQKPNVVLIVIDSLRADGLGCYGDEPSPSPAIDRLAEEGVRFERAVAPASWNLPSVSSLITSAPPWVHGQGAPATGATEVATLAETFAAAGYRTGAFTETAWPLLQRGFETFQNTAFGHTFGDPEANSADRTLEAALEWAREDGSKPFFLLVHTYEVHSYFLGKPRHRERARAEHPDYEGPFREWAIRDFSRPAGPQVIEALLQADEDDLAYVRSLYRGAVAEADAAVGRFVEGLQQGGLDEGTILTLTSSNGEGFRPDLKRVHHGGRLHHDLLHVPLIVRWPGRLEPAVNGSLVATLDVAPTLVELAGLPEQPLFTGRPVVAPEGGLGSLFHGPRFHAPKLTKEPIVAEEAAFRILPSGEREPATGPQYALYLDWVTFIDSGDHTELYDLKDDPEQEVDRSGEHVKGVKGLRKQVRRIAESTGADADAPDAEQLEQLRSLGYVQ